MELSRTMKNTAVESLLLLGPIFVALGLIGVIFQVQESRQSLDRHVLSFRQRDERWEEVFKEIREHVKSHESSMKLEKDDLDQILHWQQEILATIRERKLNSLMSSRIPKNWLSGGSGEFNGELATDMSTGR